MRQVFSSPRIENVEGVAQLLRDAGIEVRVSNGRSYRSAIRGNFSYRDNADSGPRPAVWIIHSDDQPRARQLLRDAGLLHSAGAPMPIDSYVPQTPHLPGGAPTPVAARRTVRFRYGLLAGIALLVALTLIAMRRPAPDPAPAPAPATARTAPAPTPPAAFSDTIAAPSAAYIIATPPALAEMLFAAELRERDTAPACLAIDGADPAAELIARLRDGGADVRALSACADATGARIDVTRYRTDGSGVGTVAVVVHGAGDAASTGNRIRRLEVQRTGDRWRVLREFD